MASMSTRTYPAPPIPRSLPAILSSPSKVKDQEEGGANEEKGKRKGENEGLKASQSLGGFNVHVPWWAWVMTGVMVTVVALWVLSLCYAVFKTAWVWQWPSHRRVMTDPEGSPNVVEI